MYCSMQEQVKRERQVNPLNGREHYGMTLHTNVKMYMYSEFRALSELVALGVVLVQDSSELAIDRVFCDGC